MTIGIGIVSTGSLFLRRVVALHVSGFEMLLCAKDCYSVSPTLVVQMSEVQCPYEALPSVTSEL
jgi:hypothetical protein